jgi:WD40 repeat protein
LNPLCLINNLVEVVALILKTLDPNHSKIRAECVDSCVSILKIMNDSYPMFSFHRTTQKIIVGNSKGTVVFYDIITASKWHTYDAHQSPIDAISFSTDGSMISTFCPTESSCKVWVIEGSVLSILGVSTKLLKNLTVNCTVSIKTNDVLKGIKMYWVSDRNICVVLNKDDKLSLFF